MVDTVTVTPAQPTTPALNGLERNAYATNSLSYPSDIENMAHLVQFDVYVPSSSGTGAAGASPYGQTSISANQVVGGSLSSLTNSTGNPGDVVQTNPASSTPGSSITQLNSSQKVDASIHLYMPSQMQFDLSADWDTIKATEALAQVGQSISSALNGAGPALASMTGGKAGAVLGLAAGGLSAITGAYGTAVSALTSQAGQGALYAGGYAFNPIIQVIYSGPKLRTFMFDWEFAPRNASEAGQVRDIIRTFRQYSSPDYSTLNLGLLGGLFIAPGTFDITFFKNDGSGFSENNNIQRISRCACTQVTTNYNPDGSWATFKDGNPVHIGLQCFFTELQIITHDLISQGF